MCLFPRLIKNRKYTANKKNGGNVPPVTDERVKYVPIGCGNCIECRRQKAREWQVRLLEDIKTNTNGKFITLTFSNQSIAELDKLIDKPPIAPLEGYERDNQIATLAVARFRERYRKEYGTSIRHWLVTELGHNGTENIHLHGIIWTDKPLEKIEKLWKYGFMWKGKKEKGKIINYVNARTINYIIKYVSKMDEDHKYYKSLTLASPGLGSNYTNRTDSHKNKYNGTNTIETYRTSTGHKISMPIYWRNKIYSEQEREQLWLQRLDKNERWVMGEKINVANGHEKYHKLLKYYQELNTQLGYGNDIKDWSRANYEQQRRNMKQLERIKNASGGVCLADGQGNRLK